MTANQINYAKYLEDVRTHKASEEINRRQAAAAEKQADVAEVNAATNRINAETNQYNSLINESAVGAQWYGAQANRAYQETMAAVSQQQAAETKYHNRVTESQDLLKHNQDVTLGYYKVDQDVKQKIADRTQRYVELAANGLIKVGQTFANKIFTGLIG